MLRSRTSAGITGGGCQTVQSSHQHEPRARTPTRAARDLRGNVRERWRKGGPSKKADPCPKTLHRAVLACYCFKEMALFCCCCILNTQVSINISYNMCCGKETRETGVVSSTLSVVLRILVRGVPIIEKWSKSTLRGYVGHVWPWIARI